MPEKQGDIRNERLSALNHNHASRVRATTSRKPSGKESRTNGRGDSGASVARLNHHRLYREIVQLRRHGQEVLARTQAMMSLLKKNLRRAQGFVDEQKKLAPGGAEIRMGSRIETQDGLKTPDLSAGRSKPKGSAAEARARRPA